MPLVLSLYHKSPLASSRNTNCTPVSSSAPDPGRSTDKVCNVAHSPSFPRHASPVTNLVSTEISETGVVEAGQSALIGKIHCPGSSRDTPQCSIKGSTTSVVNTIRRVGTAFGPDVTYICTSNSPSPSSGYTRRAMSSVAPPLAGTGALGSLSSNDHRDTKLCCFLGLACEAVPSAKEQSGPGIKDRTSRSWCSKYVPTTSGGGSTHSSGSSFFVGFVKGVTSTTLFARLFLACASASLTSHPSYGGVSSPSTPGSLNLARIAFRLAPSNTSICKSKRAMAFSVACQSGGVSSGLPASSQRTYARMSTKSSGMTTSATLVSVLPPFFSFFDLACFFEPEAFGLLAVFATCVLITIAGLKGSVLSGSVVAGVGGGGFADAAAATRAASSSSAARAFASFERCCSDSRASADVSECTCTTLFFMFSKDMGSSSPGTSGWLYRRRISFSDTPPRTSMRRSKSAPAYSVACHSGVVSSGIPAFSHRTYARIPTKSSGITTFDTSTSFEFTLFDLAVSDQARVLTRTLLVPVGAGAQTGRVPRAPTTRAGYAPPAPATPSATAADGTIF
mmetsp:Transcript_14246/g.47248  ORF Transcript_14246/g.47248 Transcript_14246/m.47248 type:complete len:564 (-) Transcript_14246:151-1842(-)